AVTSAKRQEISGQVARKRETGLCRQDSRAPRAFAQQRIPPNYFPLFIIDRAKKRSPRNAIVRAGPAILAVLWLEEVDSVTVVRAHDKQTAGRIETQR